MNRKVYGTIAAAIAIGAVGTALALTGNPVAAILVVWLGLLSVFQ